MATEGLLALARVCSATSEQPKIAGPTLIPGDSTMALVREVANPVSTQQLDWTTAKS